MPRPTSLQGAGWLFVAGWTVHTADHVRRGVAASPDGVVWAGTFIGLLAAVALTLIFTGHPSAPMVAASVFPAIAIGVMASHLPPQWGELSDPILVDSNTDGWSVVAVMSEVLAAAWLGFLALRVLRRNRWGSAIPRDRWNVRVLLEDGAR